MNHRRCHNHLCWVQRCNYEKVQLTFHCWRRQKNDSFFEFGQKKLVVYQLSLQIPKIELTHWEGNTFLTTATLQNINHIIQTDYHIHMNPMYLHPPQKNTQNLIPFLPNNSTTCPFCPKFGREIEWVENPYPSDVFKKETRRKIQTLPSK